MDTEVILCPCGPFIAFQAFMPLFFPPVFFFLSFSQHPFCPQKLLLMHFIPGALALHAASPEKGIGEAEGRR